MTPLELFRIGLEQQRDIVAEQARPKLPRRTPEERAMRNRASHTRAKARWLAKRGTP